MSHQMAHSYIQWLCSVSASLRDKLVPDLSVVIFFFFLSLVNNLLKD